MHADLVERQRPDEPGGFLEDACAALVEHQAALPLRGLECGVELSNLDDAHEAAAGAGRDRVGQRLSGAAVISGVLNPRVEGGVGQRKVQSAAARVRFSQHLPQPGTIASRDLAKKDEPSLERRQFAAPLALING